MKIQPHKNTSHLGDLINILHTQKNVKEICSEISEVQIMLNFLTSIFPNPIKYTKDTIGSIIVKPSWSKDLPDRTESNIWFRGPYLKISKKTTKNHIACQFDARSFPPWTKTIKKENVFKISKFFQKKLINIGDKKIEGIENKTNISLDEKFEIINSASGYIGIDSGLSHLSLMTQTPVYIVHDDQYCPWIFYPEGAEFISENSLSYNSFPMIPL